MALHREFADILREKMEDSSHFTPVKEASPSKKHECFHPILNFFAETKTWTPRRGLKAYPRTRTKKQVIFKPTSEPQIILDRLYNIKNYDPSLILALNELKKMGAQINEESFSLKELKREYRKLVKSHHPDHNKSLTSTKTFQHILSNYKLLTSHLS